MPKKNIRKIPKIIYTQLGRLEDRYVVASCLKIYTTENIKSGILKHLNIKLENNKLIIPEEPQLPLSTIGKFSNRNINGHEEIRRDLPKETHYNSIETPNWGDSYYGTHTVNLPYDKYPRDFFSPEYLRIKINAKETPSDRQEYLIVFEVDQVIDRESPNFEEELLKCLNILQENVGACGVQKSGVSFDDYLKSINVSWELLPPGTRDEAINRIFKNRRLPSEEQKIMAGERYDFFMKMDPQNLIFGFSGIQRYFGALLNDDLVVFENIEYGNAIYVMFENWRELSRKTRTELLSGRYGQDFERIPHISNWKEQVINIVESHRKQQTKN